MTRRLIIGITGASGVVYGVRTLEHLRALGGFETHLVMSEGAEVNVRNLAASIASGSFRTDEMIVAPCSIKSLSGIVHSYADNLVARAADVCLKERRRLLLMVREAPLHKGHLEMMAKAADLGAIVLPPIPAFYHRPTSIEEIVDHSIGKAFDLFGIEHGLYRRWGGRRERAR